MLRSSFLSILLLTACFGSLSPDRSPTGPGPEVPGPPPPSPTPPPPPPVAIAQLKVNTPGSVAVGSQAQVSVTALDANGKVVSHASLVLEYYSRNPAVFTVNSVGLVSALKPGSAFILVVGGGFTIEKAITVVD